MKKKQHLYLVFGGNLKKIGKDDFSDVKALEYIGIYESLKEAKKSWKSQSIKNIDFANKKFKLIPLSNVFDPAEKIIDYVHKLKLKKIKIDKLIFNPEEDLISAANKLQNANAGAGVVINNNKLLGIVTERDIVKALAMKKKNILTTKLKNIMTKKVVYININYSLIEAIETLKASGFRHLPIFDDKGIKFYGIISYKDFLIGGFY